MKPGQVGTSNATKPDNLGKFDYAHLRVPLPKDLKGSGVISMLKSGFYPEAYFLMVWRLFLPRHVASADATMRYSGGPTTVTLAQQACSRPLSRGHRRKKRRQKSNT